MMDSFSRQDLQQLMASQGGPHLSVYLPSPERPNEANQDAIRLSSAIRSSQEKLVEFWMPKSQSRSFLEPLNELCGDSRFLADRSTAIAIFRSTDLFRTFRIDPPQEEKVVIGRTFHKTRKGDVAHLKPTTDSTSHAGRPATVTHLIFPRFTAGSSLQLLTITKARALIKLCTNSFNYEIMGSDAFETLAELIEHSDCLLLEYSDLDHAVAWFDSL